MLMTVEDRKHLITRILTPRSDVKPDAAAIADLTRWSWERMALHLTPLIGEAGFHSLYFRALHLTQSRCPDLMIPMSASVSTEDLFKKLSDALRLFDATAAECCSSLLLNKFTELISSMIGDVLTGQILRSAWDDPQEQGNAQEMAK